MDRKSWLWKKKAAAAAPDLHEQLSVHDENCALPENGSENQCLPPEEIIKLLSAKLEAKQSEMLANENLVKQHAKVAEEAVSGWEKSEVEAASVKMQLEECTKAKSVLEDRVLQLDNGLKECVRQLRLVREQQEQKVEEAVTKKTKEWDKSRLDLERQLVDVTNKLSQAGAHYSTSMSKTLQERNRAIMELTDAKLEAEKHSKYVQARLETVEKEYLALKYDFQVLQKDFEIRNEENVYNKKMVEAGNKQQLESVKKIAKLEGECERLRMLVRKKLPGPAALAEMRMEAGSFRRESVDSKASRKDASQGVEVAESDLIDRFRSMEEETTLLKEILAKKNSELHEARLMCAKTASKLSSVEEQLKSGKAVTSSEDGKSSRFELMDDFIEMEKLASAEQNASHEAALQAELEATRQECDGLRGRLTLAEERLKSVAKTQQEEKQAKKESHSDNELDKARLRSAVCRIIHLIESMAQEYGVESSPEVDSQDGGVQKLVSVSKNLLQGKVTILDFVSELPCVLDFVAGLGGSILGSSDSRKSLEDGTRSDKVVVQLRSEISDLEGRLRSATESLESMVTKLSSAEQQILELQSRLATTTREKEVAECNSAAIALLKDQLDAEARYLRESLKSSKAELQEEQRHRREVEDKINKEEASKLQKVQEKELAAAAEKLDECQRTIRLLGKQLESLGLPPAEQPETPKQASRLFEPQYHHIQKQETYWSSSMTDQKDEKLYQLEELLCGVENASPLSFEVKTPMRHQQQQQRRSKICRGSSEHSKSITAAGELSLPPPPEKHGLARLFSRVKPSH